VVSLPTPWTVQQLRYVSSGTDAHGNPVEGFAAAQDVKVYGWWVPQSDEPGVSGQDRVTVDVKLAGPPSLEVGHRDRFVLPSGTFDVVGDVEDYTHGPFGWQPGVVVNLRRVEG
jgi:hypothetical protein